MTDEDQIKRKALRKHLRKALEAYKAPITPKFSESLQEAVAADNLRYEQKLKEFLAKQKKDEEQLEAMRTAMKRGKSKTKPLPPSRRRITLEE
jgi:hypothetical protein